MRKIVIGDGKTTVEVKIETLDNPTARKISEALPVESRVKRWGDEIYFDTGIVAPSDGATLDVNIGDIAYWPEGKCLCIFFGRTPASTGDKPAPASECVIVGRAKVDPAALRKVRSGAKITVT